MNRNNSSKQSAPSPLLRTTFLAALSLLLTVAVAVSLTLALFVKEVDDNTVKIQAGDLDLSAKYVKLEGSRMDTDPASSNYGKLIAIPAAEQTKNIDLTEEEESIFNIEYAVPTLTQTATVEIANTGNVAFEYEVYICDLVMLNSAPEDAALASQILITMSSGSNTVSFMLNECDAGTSILSLGEMLPGASTATVTVTATFLNDADTSNSLTVGDNMKAANGGVSFDITIIATQAAAA